MSKSIRFWMSGAAIVTMVSLFTVDARASWHSGGGSTGSWGGSWGGSRGGLWSGYGSSGYRAKWASKGSWGGSTGGARWSGGSWGGSRGGLLARMHARWKAKKAARRARRYGGSYGSGGSWGGGSWGGSQGGASSGGTWSGGSGGSWGGSSGGSWGGSSGYGGYSSSPGAVISSEVVTEGGYVTDDGQGTSTTLEDPMGQPSTSSEVTDPADTSPSLDPDDLAPTSPLGDQTRSESADSFLIVHVPSDAQVYVNGVATRTPGSERTYISSGLKPNRSYRYQVRAEVVRNGRRHELTRRAMLSAGKTTELRFDFGSLVAAETTDTRLTLNVPEDAKVTLAGSETNVTGTRRVFFTNRLSVGQSWDSYQVSVSVNREGRTLTRDRLVTLKGGDDVELTFEFTDDKIASAR